jgi:choline dehydrogenase-like flavoprotein
MPTGFGTNGRTENAYDAIVVGSGITGGWAAKELTQAGLKVLILEAGPSIEPCEVSNLSTWTQERRAETAKKQPVQSRHISYWYQNPTLFVDDEDHPYTTDSSNPYVWIRGRQVGGRSLTWGAVTVRFSDYEFLAADRDGIGERWPLDYSELEPFYDAVEQFIGIEGTKERLEQLPDGAFLSPPPLTEPEIRFKRTVEESWKDRKVIGSRGVSESQGPSHGSDARWPRKSSLYSTLHAALSTGRATLRPDSIVSHLLVDKNTAAITGVACVDRVTRDTFEVFGRVVVLCASTIESIRIMLNSKSCQHPGGVGNSSGLLGCFLLDHMSVNLAGIVPGVDEGSTNPVGGAHGIYIPKFRNLHETRKDFVRGYGMLGFVQRPANQFLLSSLLEVLPDRRNRIEIDESKVDSWGIKTIRVNFSYSANEYKMQEDAENNMREMLEAAKLTPKFREVSPPGGYVHELGGARMGSTPSTSVLNRFNQCWDAKNLFVLDGSCFVTSGWQNPSLTMMALAVRACAYGIDELKRGNL